MTEQDSRRTTKAERAATTAVAVAGAAVAQGPTAAALALLALFPPIVGAMLPQLFERKAREARIWWSEILGSSGADRAIAAEIESKLEQPAAQEAVMAGFRALFDRLAPSTRTPLAMLTREYARAAREPDWFFRAVARTLTDVTEEEYEGLKLLVSAAVACRFGENTTLRLNTQPGADDAAAAFKVETKPEGFLDVQGGVTIMRVFSLLISVGLAAPPKSPSWGLSDSRLLIFRPGVLRRIHELLLNPVV